MHRLASKICPYDSYKFRTLGFTLQTKTCCIFQICDEFNMLLCRKDPGTLCCKGYDPSGTAPGNIMIMTAIV